MIRRASGQASPPPPPAEEYPPDLLPTESDDDTYEPSDSGSSDAESVGSNDVSVTLGSEERSASSTSSDLGGFIVPDDVALEYEDDADAIAALAPPEARGARALRRAGGVRPADLEAEIAAILAAMRGAAEQRRR